MYPLQRLRLRSEGYESNLDYDNILHRFRCTSYMTPPPNFVDSRLLSCAFARKEKQSHILAVTSEEGQIIVLDTHSSKKNSYSYYLAEFENDTNALFSVQWSEIDMKLITTSGDNAVGLWNLRDDGRLNKLNAFKAHSCSVKTACFKPQNSDIFASGGRDGNIYIWDSRTPIYNEPEQFINNCHKKVTKKNENASITCVVYQDEFRLISCADTDSNINVWDLRKTYLRTTDKPIPVYQLPPTKKNCLYGYTHLAVDKNCTKLFANSLGHHIYCFNISSYSKKPETVYSGHAVRNFFSKISLSPDGKYIACADSDDKIFIWKLRSPGNPIAVLSGNPEMLNGLSDVSWCPEDHLKLATSSDFPSPWIWTVSPLNDDQIEASAVDPNYIDISSAACLRTVPIKCQQNSAMTSKLFRNRKSPYASLSPLKLPNSVVDGCQVHTSCAIQKKPKVINNWLTILHNQKKEISIPDDVTQTPSPTAKTKSKKRKKQSMSPGNNLIKYFKIQDENNTSGN